MRRLALTALAVWFALAATAALAQDRVKDLTAQGAQVFGAGPGQSLTLPSQSAPAAVVASFLRAQGFDGQTIASLVQSVHNPVQGAGLTHLRFEQSVQGSGSTAPM